MVTFRINLLKDQVLPQPARRNVYRVMMAYIAVSGCILVALSYWAAIRMQSAFRARSEIGRMEAYFRMQHPDGSDIVSHGRDLNRQLDAMSATLQTINAASATRAELARILLAIAAPLPSSANLAAVELQQSQQLFEFEVDFPVGAANGTVDATQFLNAWNSNATLQAQVGSIRSVKSQRRNLHGRPTEIWRFAGSRLTGGK